jgi:hypothetical protein
VFSPKFAARTSHGVTVVSRYIEISSLHLWYDAQECLVCRNIFPSHM